MRIYIYTLTNTVNNRIYVGSTKNSSHRFARHRHDIREHTHSNSEIKADSLIYKVNDFSLKVIDSANSRQSGTRKENYYITVLNALDPIVGYNRKKANKKGFKHSHTTKKLMSINRGTIVSSYNLAGTKLDTYYSMTYAAKSIGSFHSKLSIAIAKRLILKDRYWAKGAANTISTSKYISARYSVKEVSRYSHAGILLNTYTSMSEASKQLGIHMSSLSAAINNRYISKSRQYSLCAGYRWARGSEQSI